MAKFFFLFLALASPILIKGVPVSESFQNLINQAAGDFREALIGTTGAVSISKVRTHILFFLFISNAVYFNLFAPVS